MLNIMADPHKPNAHTPSINVEKAQSPASTSSNQHIGLAIMRMRYDDLSYECLEKSQLQQLSLLMF